MGRIIARTGELDLRISGRENLTSIKLVIREQRDCRSSDMLGDVVCDGEAD
jgi:hypothetical protein